MISISTKRLLKNQKESHTGMTRNMYILPQNTGEKKNKGVELKILKWRPTGKVGVRRSPHISWVGLCL